MLNAMIVEAAKDNVIVAIEPIAKGDTVTYNCARYQGRRACSLP